jgi:alpha-ketoglutarate-dependent taurine dioxygenase
MEQTLSKTSLGAFRRKPVDLSQFSPVRESQLAADQPLPLILEPVAGNVDLAEWVRTNHDQVEQKLHRHGGVLFRGFGVKGAQEFERVAASVCSRELYSEYGDLPREGVAGKVYTSTPYPEDKSILFHNEGSHMSRWPGRINFFTITVAPVGGATPIVDCRRVYHGLDPKIRQQFEEKGLLYTRSFADGLDVSWQRFFGTEDRTLVEDSCRKQGMTCHWSGKDNLRISQRCEAVRRHPKTGELTFFNQVQLHHISCLDPEVKESLLSIFKPDDLPRHVYFGDGSPIEDSVMEHVGEVYERYAVRFQWQVGDLVSLDNMLVAHARDPFSGPRKVIVAIGDMLSEDQFTTNTNGEA